MSKINFLHSHPATERLKGIDDKHVIVDKKDWELAKDSNKTRIIRMLEEKITHQKEEVKQKELEAIINAYRTIQAQTEQLIAFYEKKLDSLDKGFVTTV